MLNDNYLIMLLRLLITIILCGVIGIEREKKEKPAGIRTHIMVGIFSCAMMLLSLYGFKPYVTEHAVTNLERIPAYVISGISFLGAGAIMKNQNTIKGLTTGASIWVAAGIGLVAGAGMIDLAITITILVFSILHIIARIERNSKIM